MLEAGQELERAGHQAAEAAILLRRQEQVRACWWKTSAAAHCMVRVTVKLLWPW